MNTLKEKQQLQKRLKEIADQEQKELQEKAHPNLEAKYLGKHFVIDNGYSAKERWNLYQKVIEIKQEDIYSIRDNEPTAWCKTISFQVCSDGEIIIKENITHLHSLGKQINETVYISAWNRMIDKINALQ